MLLPVPFGYRSRTVVESINSLALPQTQQGETMPICAKCEQSFPNRIVINGHLCNVSRRRFCLSCSPFGGNGKGLLTRTAHEKLCAACHEWKLISDDFYTRADGSPHSYCKACVKEQSIQYRRDIKDLCIDYKGGHCALCSYHNCRAALEFHHLDPAKKDICIARCRTSFENMKSELDKCLLLCSNCHREVHEGVRQIPLSLIPVL
jgi:hypothetical protein